jgi:hypothetical protein
VGESYGPNDQHDDDWSSDDSVPALKRAHKSLERQVFSPAVNSMLVHVRLEKKGIVSRVESDWMTERRIGRRSRRR